jgi:O-antigen/teichoic acid export membrane protein
MTTESEEQQAQGRRAVSHSAIYAFGNVARQLAGFIMLPVYTRHLTPEDYGVVGLLIAAMSLIEVFFGARLAQAVPRFYYDQPDEKNRQAVVSTALIITSAVSLITVAVLVLLREPIGSFLFNSDEYGLIVGLFSTLLLTQAVEYYALTYIRILERPWLFVILSLAKLALQLGLNIWLVVVEDLGILGVAIGSASSSAIFAALLGAYTFVKAGVSVKTPLAVTMLKYCWPLWLGGLAGLYMGSADRYYINLFSSTADVGLFELATKFAAVLSVLVWQPFDQYWQTERFKIHRTNNAQELYGNVFQTICILLMLAALGISLFAEPVIMLMASPDFYGAMNAIPFLCASATLYCLNIYCNLPFLITDKTLWISKNTYITAGILTVLFLALIPPFGFVGAAAAGSIAFLVQFFLLNARGKALYDMNISVGVVIKSLVIFSIGSAVSLLTRTDNIITVILINIVLFLVFGGVMAMMLLKNPAVRLLLSQMLPKFFGRQTGSEEAG